jgi:putative ABC transport system permease protein
MVSLFLTFSEMWRNRGRFLLFCLVIALITTLVLFTAALAEGLGLGNKEYIEKLNGELIAYKSNVDLSIGASRLERSQINAIRRVPGVKDVGAVAFSNTSIVMASRNKPLGVSLIGVEPGNPGEPPVAIGRGLSSKRAKEAIIDRNVAIRTGLTVGSEFTVKSIQGTTDEYYTLQVVGISDGRQYFLQPAIIVPYLTWDQIRPGIGTGGADFVPNVAVIQLTDPANIAAMSAALESNVNDIRLATRKAAYEASPGYSEQQSTLNTQSAFVLMIGVLVIGGFFQIQTLQKVPQIGMLKAIGASNGTIAAAAVVQIVAVMALGVLIGSVSTLGLSLSLPPAIPIVFSQTAVATSVIALMLIGPLGGLVSVRYSLRVEPLTALGLTG